MELLTYALLKPMIPFLTLLVMVTIGWKLSDMTSRRLTGNERSIWAFVMLVLPPLGSMFYDFMGKKSPTQTATETEVV